MRYLLTGATGFLGRNVLRRLLERDDCDQVVCLVRSPGKLARVTAAMPGADRVRALTGDLTADGLGLSSDDLDDLRGVEHVVHLGAVYDITTGDELNHATNVDGTRRVVELAERIGAGCLHHVSSVAVAGDHHGRFAETDFDTGQRLLSPYHRTKFAAEEIVRRATGVPWRVYRPAVVVGDSRTGEMDKVDGPYYLLPALDRVAHLVGRTRVPAAVLPVVLPDLGATNVVPVDYVADAMVHLMHRPGLDHRAFHLVSPRPQPLLEVYNAFATAAGAPRAVAVPGPLGAPAKRLGDLASGLLARVPGATAVRDAVLHEIGFPPEAVEHAAFNAVFDSTATREALEGSGIAVPELSSYAAVLYAFWRDHLDPNQARRPRPGGELSGRTVLITGASSGIGRATALKVAARDGIPLLVARRADELELVRDEIVAQGYNAFVYTCDITDGDAVDALVKQLVAEHGGVDMLVNNAGRSIRRSVKLSYDRFHDYERTMAINYFGAVRLTLALMPSMAERRFGHIVNISSIGVQTNPPRFSAYVASKAALDAFARVVSSETYGDGITFTTVHMPLVRTPMIRPTTMYDAFPAASPDDAADLVVGALEKRPKHVGTTLGTLGALGYTIAPRVADAVLHVAYRAFPDSAAAAGDSTSGSEGTALSRGARAFVRVLPGVHW
ncbi:MAG TPA: SDR family oxidoreductase [Kribbellaceae bacterium]|nr:SDR family oxidoreductase [Kribbellaceae bacterium]